MSSNSFRFKRFEINQDGCAMKVGTDGVLLGAWCRIDSNDKVLLDIGTGTGVIALQLAQRIENINTTENPTIEAIEIDPVTSTTARRNFDASEWGSRLVLHTTSVQRFACLTPESRFDHIISNPPYFTDSLPAPDPLRNTARHTGSLSYQELIDVCDRLLKPLGRISLILPAGAETDKMIATAAAKSFALSRRTDVHSTPKSGPKRTLMEFTRTPATPTSKPSVASATTTATTPKIPPIHDTLIIGDTAPGSFSAQYRTLTRDFYLYFE